MKRSLDLALEILKCDHNSSYEDIKTSYRTFIKKYHPDNKSPESSEEKTISLNNAFNIIEELYEKESVNDKESINDSSRSAYYQYYSDEFELFPISSYFWNPQTTTYYMFVDFINSIIKSLSHSLIKKYNHTCFKVINTKLLGDAKLFNLIREQYIKPYFALTTQLNASLEKCISEKLGSCSYTVDIYLRGTAYEGRTKNIENCEVGDPIILCAYGDNEDYPEKIEAFDMNYNSLGTIPVELAVCITPLFLSGNLTMEGKIKEIIDREKRGKRARKADMMVTLRIELKHDEKCDNQVDNTEKIINILENYSNYYEEISDLYNGYSDNDLLEFINNNYINHDGEIRYDRDFKQYFSGKGNRIFDYYTVGSLDDLILNIYGKYPVLEKENDALFIISIRAFTNGNILRQLQNRKVKHLYTIREGFLFLFSFHDTRETTYFDIYTIRK